MIDKKHTYINGMGCVSIQPTTNAEFDFSNPLTYSENPIKADSPTYKDKINPMQLRRMGNSIKMTLFAGLKALEQANNPEVDAIITGTGEGCLTDTEKFLELVLEAEDQNTINPTAFIQSTHNMSAAALALHLGCKGYNMTYVNDGTSFETALQDGLLYLDESKESTHILVGGVDELGPKTVLFWEKLGWLKTENVAIPANDKTLTSSGEIFSEGAAVFCLSNARSEHSLAEIIAVETANNLADKDQWIEDFLTNNMLEISDLDAVVLGIGNGANEKSYYNIFDQEKWENIAFFHYKHVLGTFDTIQAVGLFMTCKIMNNEVDKATFLLKGKLPEKWHRILLYHQKEDKNHSLILIQNVV